jgi:hypothetical protein
MKAGEWHREKHGVRGRRTWRKLHLTVDAATSTIVAATLTQRDGHIQSLADKGRLGWQRETDYGKRSKAKTAMSRYKRILGDHLHARKLPGQQAEAAIGVAGRTRH